MTAAALQVLMRRLADGDWHAVDDPFGAAELLANVQIQLETDSVGRCRLAAPVELLDAGAIEARLSDQARRCISRVDVHTVIDSTNDHLQRLAAPAPGSANVCLAEFQHAGRGRRGKTWIAPFGQSLCLSVAWHFEQAPRHVSAASLAVAVGMARALHGLGVERIELKWPNDLYCAGRKLGGVLIDAQGSLSDLCVVVGVGLNLRLGPMQQARIDAQNGVAATDLASLDETLAAQRNRLAATLASEIVIVLRGFGAEGFTPWAEQWPSFDYLRGKLVEVATPEGAFAGLALGVDESGALLVQQDDHVRRVLAGEVSVRAA